MYQPHRMIQRVISKVNGNSQTAQTKLTHGRQNEVDPAVLKQYGGATAQYDEGLYCYLIAEAEQQHILGTVDDVVTLFEHEFPDLEPVSSETRDAIHQKMVENGIANAPDTDELKRDAAIAIFVSEYSKPSPTLSSSR